jgi:hypothetical protein
MIVVLFGGLLGSLAVMGIIGSIHSGGFRQMGAATAD